MFSNKRSGTGPTGWIKSPRRSLCGSIENKSSRQVTFCKRRNGLIEKARQLSVLCESSVAVFVVSATGKLYNSSSGDNLSKIIDRYKIQQADDLQTLDLEEITRNYLPHKKLLELVQSNLEEANVDGVSVDSLNSLEEQLETALSVTRATKTKLMMEFLKTRREKEKLLIEENLVLASKIWKQTFLVTRDETSMLPEYRFGNNPPETLSLLK
ncbi:hypothetical protein BRARA_F02378 [Brassica rapa]|uniref:Uncharacterized protein n=1 Tax=Brassica campestris TaxID=3711 RepID=A0A397Z089_BRACM|nr:hypothetical protein BRARA_F02378 [Brassica rapa]